jgi:hypothetical protein
MPWPPRSIARQQEDEMNHTTFDDLVRRASDLMDRRSLIGGLSVALPAIVGLPLGTQAKKKNRKGKRKTKSCKKRIKDCREEVLPQCGPDNPPNCDDVVNHCCKKACKSVEKADACLEENFPS